MRALQIEFIKIFRPSTYIILSIMLVLFAGIAYVGLHLAVAGDNTLLAKGIDESQVGVLETLFAIFVIMNIGAEYSENTFRRSIIEGYTRGEFFAGKLLFVFTVALTLFIFQKLLLLISAGIAVNFKDAFNYLSIQVVTIQLLKIIFYGLFGFFLAFLTRGIAVGIVLYFVWGAIEAVIAGILKFKYPGIDWNIYLPVSSLNNMVSGGEFAPLKFILIPIAYELLMVLCPYLLLLRRDIK